MIFITDKQDIGMQNKLSYTEQTKWQMLLSTGTRRWCLCLSTNESGRGEERVTYVKPLEVLCIQNTSIEADYFISEANTFWNMYHSIYSGHIHDISLLRLWKFDRNGYESILINAMKKSSQFCNYRLWIFNYRY